MVDDVWSRTAARFRKAAPRWRTPLDLAVAVDPTFRRTPALELISAALVDVAEGRCARLCLCLPPQEGKTSVLQVFLLWLLEHRPESRNAVVSYEQDIAQRSGRRIRDWIEQFDGSEGTLDLGLRVRRGDHSAGRWSLDGHLGGLVCTGIGGALTGRAIDGVLAVDDALKGHEEAMSSAVRAKTWDWFRSTALTRLGPGAAVVVVGTRWHADDLIGRLIADGSEPWRVINIPALADSPNDPLGRQEGEWLVSARGRTPAEWESTRRAVGEYLWASLYQGRPAPLAGGIFATEKIRFWSPRQGPSEQMVLDLAGRVMPLGLCWTFCVADLAASMKTSADYTVIAAFALTPERDLVVLDLVRGRMSPDRHFEAARPLFERWKAHTLYVEQMMSTMTLTYEAARAGIPISPLKADSDKVTRALPAAARMEQGRVWIPAGARWAQEFIDELAAFPVGAFDDQCDALAYAARIDAAHYLPPESAAESAERRARDAEEVEFAQTLAGAFPGGLDPWTGAEVDIMRVQW